jgi:hypothetical protein
MAFYFNALENLRPGTRPVGHVEKEEEDKLANLLATMQLANLLNFKSFLYSQ